MKSVLLWVALLCIVLYLVMDTSEPYIRTKLEKQLVDKGLPTPSYASTYQLYSILNK